MRPSATETFDDLDADEASPNYWHKRLHETSALIEVTRPTGPATSLPAQQFAQLAANGADGNPLDVVDFVGEVQLPQRPAPQGLAALKLDPYREVALVYAPGASVVVNQAVISHCENLKSRFAVVDPDANVDANFQPRSEIQDSKYAALYYPWIKVADPQTGARRIRGAASASRERAR